MKHLIIPDVPEGPRRLTFYLAAEEWLALRGEDAFFTWRTRPTVIYGRNQVPEQEFDREYCIEHGIEFYRRKSGGGCVYSDGGNLMISKVVATRGGKNVETVFREYLECLSAALSGLGVEAVVTEHNDILVQGKKISGNAFFRAPKADIIHGTLLYDSDFKEMSRVLTPPAGKLAKHGVSSVRQRVANLSEFTGLSLDEIEAALQTALAAGSRARLELSAEDVLEIETYV